MNEVLGSGNPADSGDPSGDAHTGVSDPIYLGDDDPGDSHAGSAWSSLWSRIFVPEAVSLAALAVALASLLGTNAVNISAELIGVNGLPDNNRAARALAVGDLIVAAVAVLLAVLALVPERTAFDGAASAADPSETRPGRVPWWRGVAGGGLAIGVVSAIFAGVALILSFTTHQPSLNNFRGQLPGPAQSDTGLVQSAVASVQPEFSSFASPDVFYSAPPSDIASLEPGASAPPLASVAPAPPSAPPAS